MWVLLYQEDIALSMQFLIKCKMINYLMHIIIACFEYNNLQNSILLKILCRKIYKALPTLTFALKQFKQLAFVTKLPSI